MERFYTLQGEGFYTGRAAYFIRLAGCDVGCVWCDVKESWDEKKHPYFTIDEILQKAVLEIEHEKLKIENYIKAKPIFVITGGEPLLHNLDELTQAIIEKGYLTNIETSGSSALSGTWNWICLSPKKFKPPLPEIIAIANELKVVVFNKTDFAWAEEFTTQVNQNCKLYLQPEWEKRETITPLIVDYIKANPKWQLSLQTHKYINVP